MKITTRGPAAAQAIADRKPFTTHGALYALDGGIHSGCTGRLIHAERENFLEDLPHIDYVVFSYNTPIAWHTPAGWYKVKQKFSPTTSQHPGKLYLLDSR